MQCPYLKAINVLKNVVLCSSAGLQAFALGFGAFVLSGLFRSIRSAFCRCEGFIAIMNLRWSSRYGSIS